MVFCCTACSKNDASSQSSEAMQTDAFVKPDNYATILSVKDIPEFNFYLDEEGDVLAVEPLSENAKQIAKNLDLKEKDLEKTIGSIVVKAHEKGYIKDKATVSFSIDETKQEKAETDNILSKVTQVISKAADDLEIQIEINNNSNKSEDNNAKSENITSDFGTKNDDKPIQNKHTHTFSTATCTQPPKCSCGAMKGKPIGHKWTEATCKVAKTCSVCKTSEGNRAAHKYVKGVCSVCKQKDPNFKEYLSGKYTAQYLSNPLSNPIYNGSPLKYNIVSIEILNHRDNMEHCDVEFEQREYYLFDYAFDEGWFEDNPEYEIWEGNSKRPPTREEALRIGTNSGDIITYNSKNYCFPSGDGGYDNMVVLTKNSLTFFDGLTVNYDYDGYDTLKLISIPDDSIFATWEVKTNCVFTKEN